MAIRNLLHVDHIEPFKEWLDGNQIKWRPGVGDYEVIQIECGKKWIPIFARLDTLAGNKLVHYTIWGPVVPLVQKFLRYHKAQKKKTK